MSKKRDSSIGAFDGLFSGTDGDSGSIGTSTYSERMFSQQKGASRPVTEIPIDDLLEDPDNHKIYGNYDTDGLSESIQDNGFKGVILAYPIPDMPGKYRIESGHRSLDAAKKAGFNKVPVLITDTPKDDIERRKRLLLANLHGRVYTPLKMAEQAEYLFQTYQMEAEKRKTEGKEPLGDLNTLVAKDLEVSRVLVLKYRQLHTLAPDLKNLVEEGYGWSALVEAASISNAKQQALADRIKEKTEQNGKSACTRTWIEEQIRILREMPDDPTVLAKEPSKSEKPQKKTDALRYIKKTSVYLTKAFGDGTYLKEKSIPEAREALREMRDIIDEKLRDLDKQEQ